MTRQTAFRPRRLLAVLCLLPLLAACDRQASAPGAAGPALADLAMKNLLAPPADIRAADYEGRAVLLVFLLAGDGPCRDAVADWNALQREFGPRGFAVLGAAADRGPADALAADAASLGADFPVGHADDALLAALDAVAPLRVFPTAFLFDRDGVPLRAYPGFPHLDLLRADLAAALDGQPLPSLIPETAAP